ncbi:hypothetical protein J5N97_028295 [Dioscorea zingiberensis]|uniref:Uncharacterized protein n=1 Tax=Dioscorea zingiberensis TaxID=325984 RepID=A0A9D5BYR4_9LILI|nr:hypothetical protein J5N97_028295 [Dioscorea zingiberensis]
MESPAITVVFTPWTTDLYGPAKAEGALRWVIVKELPMFGWDLDSVSRMLKPVGDLVLLGSRGTEATEDFRAFLRIRKPRLLPCALHCSIATLQHTYYVELEAMEPALPWDTRRKIEQRNEATMNVKDAHHQAEPPTNKTDKGKPEQDHWNEELRPPEQDQTTETPTGAREEKAEGMAEGTGCPTQDVTGTGLEDPTETRLLPADSTTTDLQADDADEVDFADVIRSLTITWREPPLQHPNSGSARIPDNLDPLSTPSPIVRDLIAPNKTIVESGAHQITTPAREKGQSHVPGLKAQGTTSNQAGPTMNEKANAMGPIDTITPSITNPDIHDLSNEMQMIQPAEETGPMVPMGPTESHVMDLEINESNQMTSLYPTSLSNPLHNFIKTMVKNIETDLKKASLQLIGNTWNLINDEAWPQPSKEVTQRINSVESLLTKDKSKETGKGTIDNPPKAPQGDQAPMPKKRGRPRKDNITKAPLVTTPDNIQTKAKKTYTKRSKRKGHPVPEADQQNLISVPITLLDWPDEEILSKAQKVGVNLNHSEGNAKRALRHMRNAEAEQITGV